CSRTGRFLVSVGSERESSASRAIRQSADSLIPLGLIVIQCLLYFSRFGLLHERICNLFVLNGASGRTRTCNLLIRSGKKLNQTLKSCEKMGPATRSNLQLRDQNRYQFLAVNLPISALVSTVPWTVLIGVLTLAFIMLLSSSSNETRKVTSRKRDALSWEIARSSRPWS